MRCPKADVDEAARRWGAKAHPTLRSLAPSQRLGHYATGYDPARAAALLRQAGYARGPDGIMAKNGKRLSFTALLPGGSEQGQLMAEMLAEQLRAAGIEMKLQGIDLNQLINKFIARGSDWQASYTFRSVGAYPTGEADFATNGITNAAGYSDPEMDRLIDASINQPGPAGLYAYELYVSAQVPAIFAVTPPNAMLVSNRLHGVNDFYDPAGQLAPEQLTCTDEN